MLQIVQVFLADTLTTTACRSVSSSISLNRQDLLTYIETPYVELSSTELLVMPTKPFQLKTLFSHS